MRTGKEEGSFVVFEIVLTKRASIPAKECRGSCFRQLNVKENHQQMIIPVPEGNAHTSPAQVQIHMRLFEQSKSHENT